MIERNIDKNSWRINLPVELMEKLNWNKGDKLLLDVQENNLVIIKPDEEMLEKNRQEIKKEELTKEDSKHYSNGRKIPPKKKTPCGLFEFSKKKYVDNKCAKCNADISLLMQHPDINCPIAKQNYKEVVNDIANNIENENKITENTEICLSNELIKGINKEISEQSESEQIEKKQEEIELKEIDPEIIKQIEQRYKELSKITIQFLSSCSNEEKIKFAKQIECPLCGNEIIKNCGIVRNNKLICDKCKSKVLNEIRETCELQRELNERRKLK